MGELQIDNPDFRQRPKPVGFEIAYKIEGDTLVVDQMRKIERVPLRAVEEMRLVFDPGNISARGFKTRLRLRDGRSLTFGNLSWKSFVEVDRQEESYRAFVPRLAAAIAAANPQCRFVAGRPRLTWGLFALLAGGAILAMALFGWSAWARGQSGAAFLALVLALLGVWQMEPMVRLNRPRDLRAGEIPPEMLP